ncbi:MAG TPA: hypothetical protein VH593_01750, partial [Ktedonobacteraceae bacterium]
MLRKTGADYVLLKEQGTDLPKQHTRSFRHHQHRREARKPMSKHAIVAGVGMIPFVKPGTNAPYPTMGSTAAQLALQDAGIEYTSIQLAYVGYIYGDSTCGQAALYQIGCTGIPIINVNNNCSSGSTALYLARQAVEAGIAECVLA